MKNESKEIVLEEGEKYKRVARKPEQSEPECVIINSLEKNLNGEWIEDTDEALYIEFSDITKIWIEDTDEALYIEFSDITKIYKAWGEKSKGDIFVEHIQSHLKPGQEVICKICNKTVGEIYQELKSEKEQANKGGKG